MTIGNEINTKIKRKKGRKGMRSIDKRKDKGSEKTKNQLHGLGIRRPNEEEIRFFREQKHPIPIFVIEKESPKKLDYID